MLRKITWLTCGVLLLPLSLNAQDSPLEFFPANADLVVRLNEPDQTIENVATLVDSVVPGTGVGDMIRDSAEAQLGQMISNPTLAGVDITKAWYLGVFAKGQEEPSVVFAIPAIDTDDLTSAIGSNMDSDVHGNWVLYTDRGEVPGVAAVEQSVAKSINKKTADVLNQGDLGLYVNAKHLRETYAEELETAHDQALDSLNQLRFLAPQMEGVDIGAMVDIYGSLLEKFYQAVNDSQSFAAAVDIDATGIKIEEYLEVGSNSESAKLLSSLPTSEFSNLNKLPKDGLLYYGISGGIKDLTKWSMGLTGRLSPDSGVQERIAKVSEGLDEIELPEMTASMNVGDAKTGLVQVAGIAEAKPAAKYREYMRGTLEAMNDIELPGMTQKSSVAKDAESYGDLKADVVTITQEIDPDQPGAAMQMQMQQALFGTEGIQSRIVYLDDEYLTIMGGGQPAAKDFIENYQAGRTNGTDKSREGLMDKSNVVVLFDLANTIAKGLKFATQLEGIPVIPIDPQMIDNLFLTSSYAGVAIAVEENSVRCRTQVPVAQMQNVGKVVMMLAPLAAGLGGGQF